jgi:DNA-binding transcriptional ArsR family regulator
MITEKAFKALGNEDRIEMIKLLAKNGEMRASDIERRFYIEQSTCSHHLNYLKRQGILKSRKRGRDQLYSINHDGLREIRLYLIYITRGQNELGV